MHPPPTCKILNTPVMSICLVKQNDGTWVEKHQRSLFNVYKRFFLIFVTFFLRFNVFLIFFLQRFFTSMNSATANSAKRDTSTAPLPRDNPACVQKSRLSGYTVRQNITVVSGFFFSKSCKNKHATLSALPSSCSINTFGQFFPKDPTICSINKLCAWRHNMSRPTHPPVGAQAPRAPPSRRNVAVLSHAEYVPTPTAAAALHVKSTLSKAAW